MLAEMQNGRSGKFHNKKIVEQKLLADKKHEIKAVLVWYLLHYFRQTFDFYLLVLKP